MRRRSFLKYAACGATTIAVGAKAAGAQTAVDLALTIEEAMVEQIDGRRIFMILFMAAQGGPNAAAPVLRAVEGDRVSIRVENRSRRIHGFEVPGAPGSLIPEIQPGEVRKVSFDAPKGGSYFYLDPLNAPVNRALGLHGVFVSAPTLGETVEGAPTPYSRADHTDALRKLFGALGDEAPLPAPQRLLPGESARNRFPGVAWDPTIASREVIWLFNSTDPQFNREADRGLEIDPARFRELYTPRYFTINGLAGFDSSTAERNVPKNYEGEPTVLRVLNAAPQNFAPHIHGNHVFELSTADPQTGAVVVNENIIDRDTWRMAELDRKDILLPFEQPPDIPAAAWPPVEEPFPLFYPMHCHMELSQTAAGGMYPQGLVTDWEMLGPLGANA